MKRMYTKQEIVALIKAVVNEMLEASGVYLGDSEVLLDYASIKHLLDFSHNGGTTGQVVSNTDGKTEWITPGE